MLNEEMFLKILKTNYDYILNNIDFNNIKNKPFDIQELEYFNLNISEFDFFAKNTMVTSLPQSINLLADDKMVLQIDGEYVGIGSPALTTFSYMEEYEIRTDTTMFLQYNVVLSNGKNIKVNIEDYSQQGLTKVKIIFMNNDHCYVDNIRLIKVSGNFITSDMLDSNLLLDNVTVAHDMKILSEPTNDASPITRKFLQESGVLLTEEDFLDIIDSQFLVYELDFSKNSLPPGEYFICGYDRDSIFQKGFTPHFVLEYSRRGGGSDYIHETADNLNYDFVFNNVLDDIVKIRFFCTDLYNYKHISTELLNISKNVTYIHINSRCRFDANEYACQIEEINHICIDDSFSLDSKPLLNAKRIKTIEFNSSYIDYLFENCDRIERIDNLIVNSPRPLTSMNRTFYGCTNLKSIDLKHVDTSAIETRCREAFRNCTNLKSILNFDISTYQYRSFNYDNEYVFQGCNNLRYLGVIATTRQSIEDIMNCSGSCDIPAFGGGKEDEHIIEIFTTKEVIEEIENEDFPFGTTGWTQYYRLKDEGGDQ